MMATIARKDLRSLFATPLGWIVLAVAAFITAFYFFLPWIDAYLAIEPRLGELANPPGITEAIVAPMCRSVGLLFVLIVPILSMRAVSEERRNHTLTLLVSAPVSMTEIVLGKFIALTAFLWLVCCLPVLMALSLYAGGRLDLGLFAANIGGLVLLGAALAAVGVAVSASTRNPIITAVVTLCLLLGSWIMGFAITDPSSILRYLSVGDHYEGFYRGLVDTADIAFYLLLTVAALGLAIRRLDRDRLQG
ncbi:MAG: ABC transporter permease [Betaproteobacteria bacterium]|nr:ABC transporter permease [Betaproteobacteria bacterium]